MVFWSLTDIFAFRFRLKRPLNKPRCVAIEPIIGGQCRLSRCVHRSRRVTPAKRSVILTFCPQHRRQHAADLYQLATQSTQDAETVRSLNLLSLAHRRAVRYSFLRPSGSGFVKWFSARPPQARSLQAMIELGGIGDRATANETPTPPDSEYASTESQVYRLSSVACRRLIAPSPSTSTCPSS